MKAKKVEFLINQEKIIKFFWTVEANKIVGFKLSVQVSKSCEISHEQEWCLDSTASIVLTRFVGELLLYFFMDHVSNSFMKFKIEFFASRGV